MVLHDEWLAFYNAIFEYPPKWSTCRSGMDSATWNCSRLNASYVYTIQPCHFIQSSGMDSATWNCSRLGASSVYTIQPCHFIQSHIRKVYACLAVTSHMHFWQNDRDFLRATMVTRGWNGYQYKSQHRKSTPEKKILFPPPPPPPPRSCRNSNPRPFSHESGALTTELNFR